MRSHIAAMTILLVTGLPCSAQTNEEKITSLRIVPHTTTLLFYIDQQRVRDTAAGKWINAWWKGNEKTKAGTAALAECGLGLDDLRVLVLAFEDVARLVPSVGILQGGFDGRKELSCVRERVEKLKRPVRDAQIDGRVAIVAGGAQDPAVIRLAHGLMAFGSSNNLRALSERLRGEQWPNFPRDVVRELRNEKRAAISAWYIVHEQRRKEIESSTTLEGLRGLRHILVEADTTLPLKVVATITYDTTDNALAAWKFLDVRRREENDRIEKGDTKIAVRYLRMLQRFEHHVKGREVVVRGEVDPR